MACNCATKDELDKLYKMYGDKSKLPDNATFLEYTKHYFVNILFIVLTVVAFPLLVLYILALLFWREDSKLHVSDFNIGKKLRIIP